MKKLTTYITCLFVMACMTSCDNNEECNHKWIDATCSEPKTCSLCKETEGEKLEHKWVDATCTEPKTCSFCKETDGEKLEHKWVDATCEEPKTCSLCKETDGEKLGHKWIDATCTSLKTCEVCNQRTGSFLQHSFTEWKKDDDLLMCEPGGKEARECTVCSYKETRTREADLHDVGEWVVTDEPSLDDRIGVKEKTCMNCKKTVESKQFTVTGEELYNLYKKGCKTYTFEEIARYPDKYKGKSAKFKGEVVQILDNGDGTLSLRVDITQGKYYWSDTIYVYYDPQITSSARILEEDIVTMYGYLCGLYTYTTVMGNEITLPLFAAEFIDINS